MGANSSIYKPIFNQTVAPQPLRLQEYQEQIKALQVQAAERAKAASFDWKSNQV